MNNLSRYDYFSKIRCNSPLKIPAPIPNATILTVLLFIRHGIRSPGQIWHFSGNEGEWNCDGLQKINKFSNIYVNENRYELYQYKKAKNYLFPPTCEKSSLTNEGINQLFELGQLYFNYSIMMNLISQTNLKDALKMFSIRSSFVTRCIESALSFLNGFFYQLEGTIDEKISIKSGKENEEPLAPSPFRSKLIYRHMMDYIKSEEYEKRLNRSEKIIQKFRKYLNISYPVHQFESLSFGDYINTLRCSNQEDNVIKSIDHERPKEKQLITPEIHKELMTNVYFLEGKFYNSTRSATIGPIFKLILEKLKKIKSNKIDHVFNLFSGHSETLSALLTAFGIENEFTPPFGSHFLIEAWKVNNGESFLRIALNGDVLKIIDLKEFKKYAKDLISEKVEQKNDELSESTTCNILNTTVLNEDHFIPGICEINKKIIISDQE